MPAKAGPVTGEPVHLPEIIHAESQRKGLRHDPAVRLG